jgi:DNA helicase II / ATP-dependent DNA helicase PcrA
MDDAALDEFFGNKKPNLSNHISERAGLVSASHYQIDIFKAFEERIEQIGNSQQPQSMIIEAVPGSGKTTVLVACSNLINYQIRKPIFLAFGNRIANELKIKLEHTNIKAMTTHSYWRSQWSNHIWKTTRQKLEMNQYRVSSFIRRQLGLDDRKGKHSRGKYQLAKSASVLAQYGKQHGLVPEGYVGATGLVRDDDDFWYEIIDYYDVDVEDIYNSIELARAALVDSLDNDTVVDFSDMLWFPLVKRFNGNRIESEKHDVVLIDETQDLNEVQRELCQQMLSNLGFVLAVGDRRQSIFAWRSADANSMDNLKMEFDAEEFPLSICYRCGTSIVDLARSVYPVIEAAPNAIEGKIEHLDKFNIRDFLPGDVIICRNNAPIITLAYRLMRAKIPSKVIGRDIGEGLITMIKKIKCTSMIEFVEKLNMWKERQIALIEKKNPDDEQSKQKIYDKYESILVFVESPDISNTDELAAAIDSMFTTNEEERDTLVKPSRINLSTVHRFKGGEAKRVFVLDKFLFNPHYARQDWQKKQEDNIRFVAYSRAMEYHAFINSANIFDGEKQPNYDDISSLMKKSKQSTKRL